MRTKKSLTIFINKNAVSSPSKNKRIHIAQNFSLACASSQIYESTQDTCRYESLHQTIDMEVKPQSWEESSQVELRERKDETGMDNEQPCGCAQNVITGASLRTLQVDPPFVPACSTALPTPNLTVIASSTLKVPSEVVTGVGGLSALTKAIEKGLTLNFDVSNVNGLIQQCATTITPPPPLPQDVATKILVDEVYLVGEIAYSLGFPITYSSPCGTLSFNFYSNEVVGVNNLICHTFQQTNPIPNPCLITGMPSVETITSLANGAVTVVLKATFTLPGCKS